MNKSWRARCKSHPNLAFGKALSNAKNRSKKRSVPFDLDKEYIIDLYKVQSGKCYYSGMPLNIIKGDLSRVHDEFKMTLDCIDPSLGYVRGNVVWCAYCVNSFKQNMSKEDMLEVCYSILNNFNIKI